MRPNVSHFYGNVQIISYNILPTGAKRIGLLFSASEVDFRLDPRWTTDIDDIVSGDEIFSDGCGLISRGLAVQVSREKKIIFHGKRYTPCVFQIRYALARLWYAATLLIKGLKISGI